MNHDLIVEWIRSFSCIEESDCKTFESLSSGFAFAKLYNFATDGKFDMNSLLQLKKEDDWLTSMKNIRQLAKEFEPAFADKGIKISIEATQVARRSKPEALPNLVMAVICFMFDSPHKKEVSEITKKCSEACQNEIKSILIANKVNTAGSEPKEAEPERPAPVAETKPVEEKPQAASTTTSSAATRTAIRRLEVKNRSLNSELEKLQAELKEIQNSKSESVSLPPEVLSVKNDLETAKEENTKLQKELAEFPDIPDSDKIALQNEITSLQQKLAKINEDSNAALSPEKLSEMNDPDVQNLLKQIKEAEDILKPEYENELRAKVDKFKEVATKMKKSVKSKQKEIGDTKPEAESGESGELESQISEITARNNKINTEIVEIMAKLDAIEKNKTKNSFLEHLRTSDAFLSIH